MTNGGALEVDHVTKTVASLTNIGGEPLSTWLQDSDIDRPLGVTVAGQSDGGYVLSYDPTTEELHAKYADYDAAADGALIDVPAGTAVGDITLRIEGRS